MAAALPPWPPAAAVMETRVLFIGEGTMSIHQKPHGHRCSVRLHGDLILFLTHGSRSRMPVLKKLDHRVEVADPDVLRCAEGLSKLIHEMLAMAPATAGYDLAPDNWVDSSTSRTPLDIAIGIVRHVHDQIRPKTDEREDVAYDLDIETPTLWVGLVYSEVQALLLACKDAAGAAAAKTEVAAGVVAVGERKFSRESTEPCAICLSDVDTRDEETVMLPCSHAFHSGSILTWFHQASTCPTCRYDLMECFCLCDLIDDVDEDDALL